MNNVKSDIFHQGGENTFEESYYNRSFNYIFDNTSLLNLGCGSMNYEKILKSEYPKIQITSVDIDCYFEKFKENTDNFIVTDLEKSFQIGSFDYVTFFEVMEHIDNTDQLLQNCYDNLKDGGYLIFGFPNLSSIYGRIELLLGYQPHILEVSNESPLFGTGIFGRLNCSISPFKKYDESVKSVHHIRGLTLKAVREFVQVNRFKVVKCIGYPSVFSFLPTLAPKVVIICKKIE